MLVSAAYALSDSSFCSVSSSSCWWVFVCASVCVCSGRRTHAEGCTYLGVWYILECMDEAWSVWWKKGSSTARSSSYLACVRGYKVSVGFGFKGCGFTYSAPKCLSPVLQPQPLKPKPHFCNRNLVLNTGPCPVTSNPTFKKCLSPITATGLPFDRLTGSLDRLARLIYDS